MIQQKPEARPKLTTRNGASHGQYPAIGGISAIMNNTCTTSVT